MATSRPSLTASDKIAAILDAQGMSIRALGRAADIPEASLRRKLSAVTDFTIPELERIATALDVPGKSVLPDSLLK